MKYMFIIVTIILSPVNSLRAQNLIAVQNGSSPSFYSTLDIAMENAQSGDTLFLPGSTYSQEIVIDKKLHLIGVGHDPDSTLATGMTRLIGNISLVAGSDQGSIEGIYLDGSIYFGKSSHPSFVKGFNIKYCNIWSIIFVQSESDTLVRYSFNSISQTIIRAGIGTYSGYEIKLQIQSILIENCIIMNGTISGLGYNSTIKNSIIQSASRKTLQGCNFDNNIIFALNNFNKCVFKNNLWTFTLSNNYNLLVNNIENQPVNSIFVNYPSSTTTFSYDLDFHLQPNCLGKNAGTDGTDIGIYGGRHPWKVGGFPSNPHIQFKQNDGSSDREGKLNLRMVIKAQER